MKKKLEAELISIAHRILKLKNRAELDVLQQETLKLYEKISVLRFVEDNFSEVKPTIGHASAEEKLEEIYGIEEIAPVHANEQEAKEDEARAEKKAEKEAEAKSQKPKAEEEEMTATDKPEGDADPEQKVEEYQASEEEKEHTEEETDEKVQEEPQATSREPKGEEEVEEEESEDTDEQPETDNPEPKTKDKPEAGKEEEPAIENKIEVVKPEEDIKAMEASAAAVYEKEDNSTPEEEEQAADAEIKTIEPDTKAKVENSGLGFDFAFERNAAPDEPKKQKEITFEDYHDYKEPEFIKKDDPQSINKEFLPKEPEVAQKQEENANAFSEPQATTKEPQAEEPVRDWRDWEPAKSEEPKSEETKAVEPQADMPTTNYSQQQTTNDKPQTTNLKTINLGLNDRIAFEKNLFGGSGEDLNRVLSQLNTMDRFDDAQNFINDLVKPDYNNWQGKEEYEERFIQLVEKRFS